MPTNWTSPSRTTATLYTSPRMKIGELSMHHLIDSAGSHLIDSTGYKLTGLATFIGDIWTGRPLI